MVSRSWGSLLPPPSQLCPSVLAVLDFDIYNLHSWSRTFGLYSSAGIFSLKTHLSHTCSICVTNTNLCVCARKDRVWRWYGEVSRASLQKWQFTVALVPVFWYLLGHLDKEICYSWLKYSLLFRWMLSVCVCMKSILYEHELYGRVYVRVCVWNVCMYVNVLHIKLLYIRC